MNFELESFCGNMIVQHTFLMEENSKNVMATLFSIWKSTKGQIYIHMVKKFYTVKSLPQLQPVLLQGLFTIKFSGKAGLKLACCGCPLAGHLAASASDLTVGNPQWSYYFLHKII